MLSSGPEWSPADQIRYARTVAGARPIDSLSVAPWTAQVDFRPTARCWRSHDMQDARLQRHELFRLSTLAKPPGDADSRRVSTRAAGSTGSMPVRASSDRSLRRPAKRGARPVRRWPRAGARSSAPSSHARASRPSWEMPGSHEGSRAPKRSPRRIAATDQDVSIGGAGPSSTSQRRSELESLDDPSWSACSGHYAPSRWSAGGHAVAAA